MGCLSIVMPFIVAVVAGTIAVASGATNLGVVRSACKGASVFHKLDYAQSNACHAGISIGVLMVVTGVIYFAIRKCAPVAVVSYLLYVPSIGVLVASFFASAQHWAQTDYYAMGAISGVVVAFIAAFAAYIWYSEGRDNFVAVGFELASFPETTGNTEAEGLHSTPALVDTADAWSATASLMVRNASSMTEAQRRIDIYMAAFGDIAERGAATVRLKAFADDYYKQYFIEDVARIAPEALFILRRPRMPPARRPAFVKINPARGRIVFIVGLPRMHSEWGVFVYSLPQIKPRAVQMGETHV